MQPGHPLEREIGVGYYRSDVPGTGGRLRVSPEDFRVRELETIDPEPPDADPDAYPFLLVRAELHDWDTNGFAAALSDRLGVSRERIDWAGTKDKRAVTTQLFSVRAHDLDADAIPDLPNASVAVVGRFGRALRYGDLAGNRFRIVVRDAAAPGRADAVTRALAAAEPPEDGGESPTVYVPNYFGHQRFGSRRAITHEVGLSILRGDWQEAVRMYAGSASPREPEDSRQARHLVDRLAAADDPDWSRALEAMPDRLGYELAILHVLEDRRGALTEETARAALAALPRNLRQLFVHAAQSYLFNRILTRRMEHGLSLTTPTVGDVVCFVTSVSGGPGPSEFEIEVPDVDRLQRVTDDRREVLARHCRRGRALLTAPLVGTETEFGDDDPGAIERAVCADLDLEPEDFDLPTPYGSSGTRRPIVVAADVAVDPTPAPDAYTLSYALPKGAYATVLAREYLKVSPEAL